MTYPRGINERPALLLVKLGNQIVDRAEDALAAMGLSGRQYMLLAVLSADDAAVAAGARRALRAAARRRSCR